MTAHSAFHSPGIDEHIFAGPCWVDNTLETNVKTVMTLVQQISTNTIDTGGIAWENSRSPTRLRGAIKVGLRLEKRGDLQHGEEQEHAGIKDGE